MLLYLAIRDTAVLILCGVTAVQLWRNIRLTRRLDEFEGAQAEAHARLEQGIQADRRANLGRHVLVCSKLEAAELVLGDMVGRVVPEAREGHEPWSIVD